MQQHHADAGIFIRSMATRGASGGLARATADLARLMDAAGKDYVIIETVGVGQDEVEIAGLAQVTVVVLVPGMGDDVQAIKAGIMEIADIFVINKADQPGADAVEHELQAMLSLAEGPKPPIIRTVATDGNGVDELLAAIETAGREARPSRDRKGSGSVVTLASRPAPPWRPCAPPASYQRRSQRESGNRNHRRQRALLHARLRSPGRGQHRDALRPSFGQLRPRRSWPAAAWRFWRATAAAIASRPRS